jgi:hypothetical protein
MDNTNLFNNKVNSGNDALDIAINDILSLGTGYNDIKDRILSSANDEEYAKGLSLIESIKNSESTQQTINDITSIIAIQNIDSQLKITLLDLIPNYVICRIFMNGVSFKSTKIVDGDNAIHIDI